MPTDNKQPAQQNLPSELLPSYEPWSAEKVADILKVEKLEALQNTRTDKHFNQLKSLWTYIVTALNSARQTHDCKTMHVCRFNKITMQNLKNAESIAIDLIMQHVEKVAK